MLDHEPRVLGLRALELLHANCVEARDCRCGGWRVIEAQVADREPEPHL